MAIDWRVFKQTQDQDLLAAIARQQVDEEGRMKILGAQNDLNTSRLNAETQRDNAETNRVYREGILQQRQDEAADRQVLRDEQAAKIRLEVEQKQARDKAIDAILADPNATPELKQIAQLAKAGVTPSISSKMPGGMKPAYRRRRDGTLERMQDIEEDAFVAPETTPAPSFTIVQTPEGQRPFDRRSASLGAPIADLPLTTDMRNRQASYEAMQPFFDEIEERSKRINVHEGLYASAVGTAAKQAAKVNLNREVAVYASLLKSLMPLAARAFGHTGVLTQQDIDSAASIFPDPGEGEQQAREKLTTLRTLMAKINKARQMAGTTQPQTSHGAAPVSDAASVPAPTSQQGSGGRRIMLDANGNPR